MPRFKKKPVAIEAFRLKRMMTAETLEGQMDGQPGDWLIVGVKGETYFCKDDIFRMTYDPVGTEDEEYGGWTIVDQDLWAR